MAHAGPHVVWGVRVSVVTEHLRVGHGDVVRLDEGFHGQFQLHGMIFATCAAL